MRSLRTPESPVSVRNKMPFFSDLVRDSRSKVKAGLHQKASSKITPQPPDVRS